MPQPNQSGLPLRRATGADDVLQTALNAELHRQWWCRDDGPVFADRPVAGDELPLSDVTAGDDAPRHDLLSFRDLLRDAPELRRDGRRLRKVA